MKNKLNVGIIKSLRLLNFIRYEDIEIEFKYGLTIITGPNGAGKSILIQSIQICLGASSLIFPNLKSISEVIMEGKQKSEISLKICNPRINGRRLINLPPESPLYDLINNETFTIHRIIKKKMNYWKIANRRIKKAQLDKIVALMNIEPTNEFIFMSQHTPDSLLNTNKRDLFTTFAGATGLEEYRKKMIIGREKIKKLEGEKSFWFEKLATEEGYLNKLAEQKNRYENKIHLMDTLKNLRLELFWVPVVDIEKEEKILRSSLKYKERELHQKANEKIKLEREIQDIIKQKEEIKKIQSLENNEVSTLSVQYSDYRSIIESLKREQQKISFKKKDKENRIKNLRKKIDFLNKKLKETKITTSTEYFKELDGQIKKIHQEINQLNEKKFDLNQQITDFNYQIRRLTNDINNYKNSIEDIKKNGTSSLLSQDTLKILKEINKTQKIQYISFVGPVCTEITIKASFKKWSKAINASLSGITEDIIALDENSLKILDKIRRTNQFNVSLGYLDKNETRRRRGDNYYSPPIQSEIINTLEGNQIVLNYINKHRNGLLSDFDDANKLFKLSKKYKMNIFTSDGFRYLPSYRSPKKGKIREIIGINSLDIGILEEYEQKIEDFTKKLIEIEKKREIMEQELKSIRKRYDNKENEKFKLVKAIELIKEDDNIKIEREKMITEKENDELILKLKEYNERLESINGKFNTFDKKLLYLDNELKKKQFDLDQLNNKASTLDIKFGKFQNKIDQLKGEINIFNDDISDYKIRLELIAEKRIKLIRQAREYGSRPPKIRDSATLISLKTEAETLISTMDINENILEMFKKQKKKVEKYILEVEIRNTEIEELKNIQFELFTTYKNDIRRNLKIINLEFKRLLIPYFGEIKIKRINNVEETSLEIFAAFDNRPLDLAKLSAGQTALTVISFLLSLQALRKTPLKIIDEFTQRLDSLNQKQIINMIIDQYERIKDNQNNNSSYFLPQFIIVTPEISNLKINYEFNHVAVSTTKPNIIIENL